ncbi:hypothetical protein L1049_006155 [Liquidambar formosana]|uniref:Uncharacterized protein n=1 Tax=Liquidambar formosana TaxID=63359 RepID=A0AAP0REZ5_LIQFO
MDGWDANSCRTFVQNLIFSCVLLGESHCSCGVLLSAIVHSLVKSDCKPSLSTGVLGGRRALRWVGFRRVGVSFLW